MAFSFGTTNQPAFGSTQAKPTGFGTAFGSTTPATTASTGFGFGSSFGATNQQQAPAFGSTFGTPASGATAPAFGTTFGTPASTFGTPASSAAPTFGTTFGTQQQPTGLFGSTAAKPGLFGAPATSTPSLFSSQPTGGSSLFGTSTTQATGLFGTGGSAAPNLFGTTTSTPSLFGQTATTTAPSLFGNTASTSTGFGTGLFGATTTAPSLFGSGFGTTTNATSTGFSGFGTTNTSFGATGTGFGSFGTTTGTGGIFGSTFGAKPATPAAPNVTTRNQQVVASVYAINVFNDERDDILKKWNMLQACWGTGKGYYNSTQPPLEYTPQNPFYRFKAMGYNIIPEQDNSDGIVKLIFDKKLSELKSQHEVLKNGIAGILGNRPNLTVDIIQIKAISDNQTEVKITVSERGVTGSNRKTPASDLSAFLNQPMQKQQLASAGVSLIAPYVTPSKAELEEYLKHPSPGIDMQMWQAAIQDNPNPKKYIPVPINGFSDLRSRMLHQEHQTGLHQAFLDKVNKDITELKTKHSSSIALIAELRQKYLELQHRILRVLVKQESTRKVGIAIQPEEEVLRGRFEMMHAQLNVPTQFKGQLNELHSYVKLSEGAPKKSFPKYKVDPDAQEEIKQFLKMQQHGIAQLVNIINEDLRALKVINEGMRQVVPGGQGI